VTVCLSTAGRDAAQKIDDRTVWVAQQRLIVAVFHTNKHDPECSLVSIVCRFTIHFLLVSLVSSA